MMTEGTVFVWVLLLLACAAPLRAEWSNLVPLGGPGAVGSPGGTHPLVASGNTVHAVWQQRGVIHYRVSLDAGRTWGHARPLTSGGTAQYPCSLEISGTALHLVWPDSRNGSWEVYYKRSDDGGRTWAADARLTPHVDLFRLGTALSGDALHVVWGSKSFVNPTPAGTHTWGAIYYKRSTDDGKTWEPDVRLTKPDASAMRPSVAAAGRYVHVTWFDRRDGKTGLDWDIYTKRSTDGGATWGSNVRMTNTPTLAHHPQIVATPDGRVCCIWEDGQSWTGERWVGDPALYASVSSDNGRTWGATRRITHVSAPNGWATHAKSYACGSRVYLAWTDAPEGIANPRAAYFMSSPDGGVTWSAPERLTQASEGACWAGAVAGTQSCAIAVVARDDTLRCCRREIPGASPPPPSATR